MTAFDFKGALKEERSWAEMLQSGGKATEHNEACIAALHLAARVQSGELVVVPSGRITKRMVEAVIAAAPKYDWSEK